MPEAPIPQQEPKPRKRVSRPTNDVLDERGFLGGSREADKAHIKVGDHLGCNCENHEVLGFTEIFRAGITDPKTIFQTYKKYADISLKEHQKYIEDGYKKPWQIAEEILIYESKKNDTV